MGWVSRYFRDFFTFRFLTAESLLLAGALTTAATLLGFCGRFHWFLDLFSHFRVQYFWTLAGTALCLVFFHKFRPALIFTAAATINAAVLLPLYFDRAPLPSPAPAPIRAILLNVNTRSGNPGRVKEFLQQQDPDLIVLEEVDERWITELASLSQSHPHAETEPRDDNFGIAVFSKHPLVQSQILYFGDYALPSIRTEITAPQGTYTLFASHPLPPRNAAYSRERNEQLEWLAGQIKKSVLPILLLGDLNATPWSHHFKKFQQSSGLLNSAQGRGIQPSWPAHLSLLWIPIDHCLHSPQIEIVDRTIGPPQGSDHYPLLVSFRLSSLPAAGSNPGSAPTGPSSARPGERASPAPAPAPPAFGR
jgi:endonuclease/exonuclease/phosphatase (EEP) superfamily protein YafD